MINRTATFIFSILLLFLLTLVLFRVKHKVMALEYNLKSIKSQVRIIEYDINLLTTELNYLKNPVRIRKIAAKRLNGSNNYQLSKVIAHHGEGLQ